MPTFEDALALHKAGRAAEAEAACAAVLAGAPNDVNALHLAGMLASQKGDYARAVDFLTAALRLHPDMPLAHNNLAAALIGLKDFTAAAHSAERALTLRPDLAPAHINRGAALRGLKRPAEALDAYDRAIALRPDDAEATNNRGIALNDLGRYDEALAAFTRAIALNPSYVEAHHNQGLAHKQLHRHTAALECFARALALKPAHPESHWETALTHLLLGDFSQGWRGYESRWKTRSLSVTARYFPQPLWLGETPLAGKTILIHAEQGLGDTLQFCRYAAFLADKGARVVLEAPAPLAPLLRDLPGMAQFVVAGDTLPAFDLHCPLMSLPLACGTTLATIPAPPAYLQASPEKVATWRATLVDSKRPRIGLVWSGNPDHRDDHNRSIPLADFARMLPEGCDYVSLQTNIRPADQATLRALPHIATPAIKDFEDTAALCALMDVVLTVDTSVAHLAGALGKPVWILLPFLPDWRWLLKRDDSPWYPSAKLYRQNAPRDWRHVFARVKSDLSGITHV